MNRSHLWVSLLLAGVVMLAVDQPLRAGRQVMRLDGSWRVAQGSMDEIPSEFTHQVPVPGLVDMATPAFKDVGRVSPLRQAFWYRREFKIDGALPPVALLKIHKAKYGSKVYVNGEALGEHLPSFTPVLFDVRKHLRGDGQSNEVLVRVGANRESLPADMPSGWDFEKYLYIPGIYDSVELILSGYPFISRVQTVPDIQTQSVRVVADLECGQQPMDGAVSMEVSELSTGIVVGVAKSKIEGLTGQGHATIDLVVPLDNCRLWSPEDPFLYQVAMKTASDSLGVKFGMREFRFDPTSKRAMLNGQPYIMRGTNVCIFRFFEDQERGDLPWNKEWVRQLHRKFKSMHWNSIRYCIGFPPEIWYEVADEEGLLIQDEFPIWLLGKAPENPIAEKIIPQYTDWMQERWNHPCVVIWDAQNESHTPETGKALQAVRKLDLSNRPWENGWAAPQSEQDCVEAHPYLFIRAWQDREPFRLHEIAQTPGTPGLIEAQQAISVPVLINEYAWLWLDRKGQPTCLTDKIYQGLLGKDSTVEQRRVLYARYLAALTEFWRCHRKCAGVLHFCGLAYSRPGNKPRPEGGATSDHFLDLATLAFEPHFEKYVRDSFNPLGIMLDFWAEELPRAADQVFEVVVINDRYSQWKGQVSLRVMKGDQQIASQTQDCHVEPLGHERIQFTQKTPDAAGKYTIIAQYIDADAEAVQSLRDVRIN